MKGQDVAIHRSGAPEVKGKVYKVEDGGCCLLCKEGAASADSVLKVFIAFESMRGIATLEWDYDVIA